MYYIIAGHGSYAESCKASCEMITGTAPSFVPVIFTDEMTKEAVEEKYAAMRIVAENKNIRLVAGLCQQLLVLLNSGEDLAGAIAQTGEIFGNSEVKKETKKLLQKYLKNR